MDALSQLKNICANLRKRSIFDEKAYRVSSSKLISNELFSKLSLAVPKKYPCNFPVIVKPDSESGSHGVKLIHCESELQTQLSRLQNRPVIEEFLSGKSYSIECINGQIFPPTEVLIDDDFDCKGIVSPALMSSDEKKQFEGIAKTLCDALNTKYIFDIEVISHNEKIKLIEIDARFPSQTPIAVFHSYGINYVKLLAENVKSEYFTAQKVCIYTQVKFENGKLKTVGEHIMSDSFPLEYIHNFHGADEAMVHFTESGFDAIVILTALSHIEAEKKLECFMENVKKGR